MKTIEMFVFGRVQGVWFRESTRRKASECGVCGFVQNMPDGSVKIVAQHANQEKIDLLLNWAKLGPEMAQVDRFTRREISSQVRYSKFDVKL